MDIAWYFSEGTPGSRARESEVEKFFQSEDVGDRSNAIVREGIQNSLDAATDGRPIRVRISIGEWSTEETAARLMPYMLNFAAHWDAVKTKLPPGPEPSESYRYLVFEDFSNDRTERRSQPVVG